MHPADQGSAIAAADMVKSLAKPGLEMHDPVELPLGALARYPGAAALVGDDGAMTLLGGSATALIDQLHDTGHWAEIEAAACGVRAEGEATILLVGLADPDSLVEASLLPTMRRGAVLLLLRRLDFENALRRSLIESRQRYKDLVEIASDFIWETDRDGRFSFISPHGALDWSARAMIGRPVGDFLAAERGPSDLPIVFRAREPVQDDIWFRRGNGGTECVAVTAVPLVDAQGEWRGARGLCRTVTDQRRRERGAAEAQLHDRLVAHLARTIAVEIDPERALAAAVSATGLAVSASGAVVFRSETTRDFVRVAHWGALAGPAMHVKLRGIVESGVFELADAAHFVIGCAVRHRGLSNGALLLWRERERGAFTAEDCTVLTAVVDPLGAAIAQLIDHERTLALSRTDHLTGLPNRRGFFAEAARRASRLVRTPGPACIVYVDLDNFKLVNDRHGHQAGDAALIKLAHILQEGSRSGDLIARLGGDEFVMWLNGVDAATAETRAVALLEACRALAHLSGDPKRPLGVSLGIALYDGTQPETPEQILARADAAMYRAKQEGKGGFVVADPPDQELAGGAG
jgi:diguanylate cyclase (GGDEF)-like protein/PAS domain S-box-containing protein